MRDGDADIIAELTPAMLAAALEILDDWGVGEDLDEARPLLVMDLWRAMRGAEMRHPEPRPLPATGVKQRLGLARGGARDRR